MRLKKGLLKRTVLRTAPGVFEERHATWLELFHDLAFVAVVGQISFVLGEHFDVMTILRAGILFVPVWWAWVGEAFFLSRFDSDDLGQRILALVQIVLVAFLAVSVPGAFQGDARAYAFTYASIRGVLVFKYVIAGWHIPRGRPLTTRYCLGFGLAAMLWVVSAGTPEWLRVLLWGLAIAIDICTPIFAVQQTLEIPPDYSHLPERFGLFTIIVLGEAILAAVAGMNADRFGAATQIIGTLGLVIAFCLWWIYFDGVKGHQVKIPRERKDIGRILIWMYSHLPLTFGIVLTAVGVKVAMHHQEGLSMPFGMSACLTASLAVVMVALHAIYWAGLNPKLLKIGTKIGLPHFVTSLATIAMLCLCGRLSAAALVSLLCFLSALHVFWTLRDLPEMDELLAKVESAKRQTASNV